MDGFTLSLSEFGREKFIFAKKEIPLLT